ncbi:MAG: hypothetical protein QM778_16700 [Myxococcales bacterium]
MSLVLSLDVLVSFEWPFVVQGQAPIKGAEIRGWLELALLLAIALPRSRQ